MNKEIQKIKSTFWKMGIGKVLLICALMLYITVSLSMPIKRLFLEDCDKNITCERGDGPMVCATDGKNYTNKCYIELENHKRYCKLGIFNPVAFVHDGKC